MTSPEFLESCSRRNRDLTERGISAAGSIKDLDHHEQGSRSPAQIFQHMILANDYALSNVRSLLSAAKSGDSAVKHTWFGKVLINASGPDGNAPTPKFMQPGEGPFGREVVDRWRAQQDEIQQIIESGKGLSLTQPRMRHPIFKIFKMNLADWLELTISHTQRHVEQIEAMAPHSHKL